MKGKIRLAAITRITRMSKCFHSSGLHVPALLEENTYIGGLKNLPIHGTAYKDFKPVSLSKQLERIPFTQPSMQRQCMRGRFQITHALTLCKFVMYCHAKNVVQQMHSFLILPQ